jgi:hypothetical protein
MGFWDNILWQVTDSSSWTPARCLLLFLALEALADLIRWTTVALWSRGAVRLSLLLEVNIACVGDQAKHALAVLQRNLEWMQAA